MARVCLFGARTQTGRSAPKTATHLPHIGAVGGGSYRQVSLERLEMKDLVKKLSKLEEEQFVVIGACPAGKHDTVTKKVAKYQSGSKIIAAWASKEAYPVP